MNNIREYIMYGYALAAVLVGIMIYLHFYHYYPEYLSDKPATIPSGYSCKCFNATKPTVYLPYSNYSRVVNTVFPSYTQSPLQTMYVQPLPWTNAPKPVTYVPKISK